jgi:hypothetical protein
VDDVADDPKFSRQSKLLHSLYTRGRHNSISTITATQKFCAISPIIRINSTELFVYRLRSWKDLECFLDEVSALIDKRIIIGNIQTGNRQNLIVSYMPICVPNLLKTCFISGLMRRS